MTPDLALHDSGVRRVFRGWSAFFRRLIPHILPMAPRKHQETITFSIDKSVVAWRGFVTAFLIYLGSGNTINQNGTSMEQLKQEVAEVKKEVGRVVAFIEGLKAYRPAVDRRGP